jgi:hypothetical protein
MDRHDFYLELDNVMPVERLKMSLTYVSKWWDRSGRPLVVLVVSERMLTGDGHAALLEFMNACREDQVGGTPVQLGRVAVLDKHDMNLEGAATEIVVHQIALGQMVTLGPLQHRSAVSRICGRSASRERSRFPD